MTCLLYTSIKRAVNKLHCIIRDSDANSNIVTRFDEISKLLFVRLMSGRNIFEGFEQKDALYSSKIQEEYRRLLNESGRKIPKSYLKINLDADTIRLCGKEDVYKRQELGLELKDTTLDQLGRAKSVKVQKETTVIVDGAGDKKNIQDRVAQIKARIEETTSEFDKEKLQERLAKLAGGVAVIRVGAATETEMKEAKLRMEDALNATRAAVEEGIVSGGGSA